MDRCVHRLGLALALIIFSWSGASAAGWYSTDWGYRKKITIDHTKVQNTDQGYFPVLISRTDTDWKSTAYSGHVAQPDGGDFLFTSSNGTTKLDHEIERYIPSTGELIAWVEVPVVSCSGDTEIYLYYGNAFCAKQWNVNGVWDDGGSNYYKGVWHFNNTSSPATDSTANANSGAASGGVAFGASGQINSAVNYNGTDGMLTINDAPSIKAQRPMTVESWIKRDAIGESDPVFMKRYNGGWTFAITATDKVQLTFLTVKDTYSTATVTDTNWHHIAVTVSAGGDIIFYIDGASAGTETIGAPVTCTYPLRMGVTLNSDGTIRSYHDETVDEARISGTVRSADWIKTEYNNQYSPSTFYSVAAEEGSGPALSGHSVLRNAIIRNAVVN